MLRNLTLKGITPYLLGFFIALGGALLAKFLNAPLPWLIGPLLITAVTSMMGVPSQSHNIFRKLGQWVIGTSLGLYFTPHTVTTIINFWPYLVLGCLFALLLSMFNAFCLKYWGHVDFKTAWFAGAVGGASEMSNLAEHYHARVDSVASSHSVRVLLVVVTLPFIYKMLGVHGDIASPASLSYHFNIWGLLQLIAITSVGIFLFSKFHIPNAWVLGSLGASLLLTSNEIHLTHLSPMIQSTGQLFIGWSLGSKYGPDFFKKAPRYLTVSALTTVAALVVSAIFAYILSLLANIQFSTMMLGVSPGGIAEMTITAKVLMLGVPIVAAFHVTRMVFILIVAQPMYKFLAKWFE